MPEPQRYKIRVPSPESFEGVEEILEGAQIISSQKRLFFSVSSLSDKMREQLEGCGCVITEDRQYQHEALPADFALLHARQ